MTTAALHSVALFEYAPPSGMQQRLGLLTPDRLRIRQRMLFVVLIGWLPLVILTILQRLVFGIDGAASFGQEAGVHARYLIAAPLLILAEGKCAASLNVIIAQFATTGIVRPQDHGGFEGALLSTKRLLRSPIAEIVVVAISYGIVVASGFSHSMYQIPAWHKFPGPSSSYSPAGWWHLLVSLPLMLMLILGWIWRVILWAGLLWKISRLNLRLLASHPDHAAGLGFVGHSVGAFSIVALALSTIAAGRSAHLVLVGGSVPSVNMFFNAGLLVATLIMFIAPSLIFSPLLLRTWHRGTLEYGGLAGRVGADFEKRWIGDLRTDEHAALEKPDFSATADLYGVVSNVQAMQLSPVGRKDLIALVAAMLIPFVPVFLLSVPVDTTLEYLKGLLL